MIAVTPSVSQMSKGGGRWLEESNVLMIQYVTAKVAEVEKNESMVIGRGGRWKFHWRRVRYKHHSLVDGG